MKLSIITINRNNAEGLQKTIESVLSQTCDDFEYIIIDGASTDNSVQIIEQYSNKISYWISEPDSGIYNAMNKGLRKARGEYIHFLNSGDWLVDENVYKDLFSNSFDEDIVYGNRIQVYEDGSTILNKAYQKSNFSFKEIFLGCIFHTCSFTKKELFEKYGYFDESFKIVSDYGFFLNVLGLKEATVKYIDITVSNFDMTGISQDDNFRKLQNQEINEIRNKILPKPVVMDYEDFLDYDRIISNIKSNQISWFFFRVVYKLRMIFKNKK